jgi:hypothetical protein
MARSKLIPDDVVFAAVLQILLDQGEKSVTFATVSAVTGLAPPTLVQRYGSCAAMVQAAFANAWTELETRLQAAAANASAAKSIQGLLKSLLGSLNSAQLLTLSLGNAALTEQAATWRMGVEAAITSRLAVSAKGKETAALIFAAWQGRQLWDAAGGKGFRFGEAVKRLS